tara:strand:+ start:2461 stop:3543 length:1083 start_codon:yes stop_codon:yes gene_type:complete
LTHRLKILLCGGGTGGHYYPLMAIKQKLDSDSKFNFCFVGAKKGIESKKIDKQNIPFKLISIKGFQRGKNIESLIMNFTMTLNIVTGFFKILKFFKVEKPALVISTGGYSSFIPLVVARFLKIPYLMHEQNSFPGIVTKIFSKNAKMVFLGFENAANYLNKSNMLFTGNPVLLKDSAKINLKLNNELKTLLIFGGSQGSKVINHVIASLLEKKLIKNLNVVWIVGEKNYETFKSFNKNNVNVLGYCNSMSQIYELSNLAITRSGAMTISELIKFKLPAILIPFRYSSENHQLFNAQFLKNNGCSELIEEEELNEDLILKSIDEICLNENIEKRMVSNFNKIEIPNSLSIISKFIEENYAS